MYSIDMQYFLNKTYPSHIPQATRQWVTNKNPTAMSLHCFHRARGAWLGHTFWIGHYEDWKMAQKTVFNVEFVNLRASKDDKERFKQWVVENEPDMAQYLEALVTSGYKISINSDDTNDCYITALTGSQQCKENRGHCMTTRGATPMESLWLALYKHFVMVDQGSWGNPKEMSDNWG